jgi:uncharacterized protein YgiM (DUF1202 family)
MSPPTQTAPTPSAPASTPPRARIRQGPANLRAGPGADFPVVGTANVDDRYQITGRSEDNLWVQVCCVSETPVWVSETLVELPVAIEIYSIVR